MGNVIPWSQIHPSITSQEPFVAVVIIDPQRQICVSEMIPFDLEALASPDVSASEGIAAAPAAGGTGGSRESRQWLPDAAQRSPHPDPPPQAGEGDFRAGEGKSLCHADPAA